MARCVHHRVIVPLIARTVGIDTAVPPVAPWTSTPPSPTVPIGGGGHTHASWLLARRVPIEQVSARLGHSSIKVTSDVYGHLREDYDLDLSELLPDLGAREVAA